MINMHPLDQVILEQAVKDIVLDYLENYISLSDFSAEFCGLTWDTDIKWFHAISLHLAEYTSKHLTENELRNYISSIVETVKI